MVGGRDMVFQGQDLSKRPHVVIATPGRLADHLQSCDTFSLKKIKYLVLDEADRLLDGGFDDQLKTIFEALPKNKQTLLFSATMPDDMRAKIDLKEGAFTWQKDETEDDIRTVKELR